MFNKLKSFSEDVAKSFNETQGQQTRRNGQADLIQQLKNSSALLGKQTPAASDLTQPSDEDGTASSRGPSENGTQEKSVETSGNEKKETSETEKSPSQLPGTSDPLQNIVLDELPPAVRAKLKKFVKYEEKYPVLLDAYKTEKRKGELILAFEKVMSEVTPVLSIADAGLLVDFLNGLTEKATLLATELRKSAAEALKLSREKDDLAKKLADSQKTLKYAEESVGLKAKAEEDLKAKVKFLEAEVERLDAREVAPAATDKDESVLFEQLEENEKEEILKLKETIREKDVQAGSAAKEMADLQNVVAQLRETEESLQKEVETLKADAGAHASQTKEQMEAAGLAQKELVAVRERLEIAEKSVQEYKSQIEALKETSVAATDLQKRVDALSAEVGSSAEALSELQSKHDALSSKNIALDEKMAIIEDEKTKLIAAAEQSEKAGQEKTHKLEALESELKVKSEAHSALLTKLDTLEKELLEAQTASQAALPPAEKEESPGPKLAKKKNKGKNKKGAFVAAVPPVSADSQIDVAEHETLLKEKDDLANQLEAALAEKNTLSAQIDQLKGELEQSQAGLESSSSQIGQKEAALAAAKKELDTSEALVKQLQLELQSAENVRSELSSVKQELESKDHDLEQLRDLLRDVGDELVTAKDGMKEAKNKWVAEHETQLTALKSTEASLRSTIEENTSKHKATLDEKEKAIEKLTLENTAELGRLNGEMAKLQEQLAAAKSRTADMQKSLSTANEELAKAKKECESLLQEKDQLNERIGELGKYKSLDSSLKLEVASLQSSITHKDEQIKDLKDTIERKHKERDDLKQSIATLKATNSDLHAANQRLSDDKTRLIAKQESAVERANALSAEVSNLQASRQRTVTELDALKLKHEALQRTRTSASDEILEYKHQYEELAMKAKETQHTLDDLQDELSEAKNLLQERTRESATLRRMLLEAEEEHTVKCNELRGEIRSAGEEKSELESNFQTLMKKRQRELDELKSISERYVAKIAELEKTCEEVRQKYEPLRHARMHPSSEDLQKQRDMESTVDELRASLQASSKRVREYENMNGILKKLNEESTMKFERLSKNYKHVTQQYRQMKDAQERTASRAVEAEEKLAPQKAEETNVAYLKNVLVGFLEHREQREQLLPVLKMLFQFDPSDEKTLLGALR